VLLLGLVISADPEPSDWIEVVAWIFLSMSFVICAFSLCVDFMLHVRQHKRGKLCRKLNILLSSGVFNLDFGNHLLVKYLEQATEQQLETFRSIESALMKHLIDSRDDYSRSEIGIWAQLAEAQPHLLGALTRDVFKKSTRASLAVSRPGLEVPNPAKVYIHSALTAMDKNSKELYPYFIFNGYAGGGLLSWMSDVASPGQLKAVRSFLCDVLAFHSVREVDGSITGRLSKFFLYSYYDKRTIGKNLAWRNQRNGGKDQDDGDPGDPGVQSMKNALSLRSVLPGETVGSQLNSRVESCLQQLASQIPCEYGMLIPLKSPSVLPGKVFAFGQMVSTSTISNGIPAADWSAKSGTPAGLCASKKKPVLVANVRVDSRFKDGSNADKSISQMCVPLSSSKDGEIDVILKVVNKHTMTVSASGLPFSQADLAIAKLFGDLLMSKLVVKKDFEDEAEDEYEDNKEYMESTLLAAANEASGDDG